MVLPVPTKLLKKVNTEFKIFPVTTSPIVGYMAQSTLQLFSLQLSVNYTSVQAKFLSSHNRGLHERAKLKFLSKFYVEPWCDVIDNIISPS